MWLELFIHEGANILCQLMENLFRSFADVYLNVIVIIDI